MMFTVNALRKLFKLPCRVFSSQTGVNSDLVHSLTVRTAVGLYPKLYCQNPSLYPINAPTDGLDVTIQYADTATCPESSKKFDKLILAVPGAAGQYWHFKQLFNHFSGTRVRVIAVNLPDFSHTRKSKGIFWHSVPEQATFLKDFLNELQINKVDCLVTHSFGMNACLGLYEESDHIKINSMALFAPQPFYDLIRQIQFAQNIVFLFQNELWYRFLELTRIYKSSYVPFKFDNIDDFLVFLSPTIHHPHPANYLPRRIDKLVNRSNIPIALLYGDLEKFISPKSRKQLYSEFGINDKDVIHIDPKFDKPSDKISFDGNRIKGYIIKGGGHFVYANFEDYSHRIIHDLLKIACNN